MKKTVKNVAGSIRARLLEHSRSTKQEFQFVLDRWAAERFLFRLSRSPLRERFVLKGATLFLIWRGALPRRTRDIDLLGYGSPNIDGVADAMKQICSFAANDGIVFRAAEVTATAIREDAEYDGIRVKIPAILDKAKTTLQIDIGFGDVIDPAAEDRELPVILPLDLDTPKLRAYPPEVVIAEKFQAMVNLDLANSRMKDFYDIWLLSQEQSFQMTRLATALRATFARRKTELPVKPPMALTGAFLQDKQKTILWRDFLYRAGLPSSGGELNAIGESVGLFLMPAVEHARSADSDRETSLWPPKGPWKHIEKD